MECRVREVLAAEVPAGEIVSVKAKALKVVVLVASGGIDLSCRQTVIRRVFQKKSFNGRAGEVCAGKCREIDAGVGEIRVDEICVVQFGLLDSDIGEGRAGKIRSVQ